MRVCVPKVINGTG